MRSAFHTAQHQPSANTKFSLDANTIARVLLLMQHTNTEYRVLGLGEYCCRGCSVDTRGQYRSGRSTPLCHCEKGSHTVEPRGGYWINSESCLLYLGLDPSSPLRGTIGIRQEVPLVARRQGLYEEDIICQEVDLLGNGFGFKNFGKQAVCPDHTAEATSSVAMVTGASLACAVQPVCW